MPYKSTEKQRQYQREHYQKNRKVYLARTRRRREERERWFRELTAENICTLCSESEQACIDYHHLRPDNKDKAISNLLREGHVKERVAEELKKCIPLCANCHRKLHAGIVSLQLQQKDKR